MNEWLHTQRKTRFQLAFQTLKLSSKDKVGEKCELLDINQEGIIIVKKQIDKEQVCGEDLKDECYIQLTVSFFLVSFLLLLPFAKFCNVHYNMAQL